MKKILITSALAGFMIIGSAAPALAQGYYGGYAPSVYNSPSVYQTYYTPAPSPWPTTSSYAPYGGYTQPSYSNYNYGYNAPSYSSYTPSYTPAYSNNSYGGGFNNYGGYGSNYGYSPNTYYPYYGTNSGIYNGQPAGGGFYPNSSCYGGICF